METEKKNKVIFCEYAFEQEFSSEFVTKLVDSIGVNNNCLFLVRNRKNIEKVFKLICTVFKDYEKIHNILDSQAVIYLYGPKGTTSTCEIKYFAEEQDLKLDKKYRQIYVVGNEFDNEINTLFFKDKLRS